MIRANASPVIVAAVALAVLLPACGIDEGISADTLDGEEREAQAVGPIWDVVVREVVFAQPLTAELCRGYPPSDYAITLPLPLASNPSLSHSCDGADRHSFENEPFFSAYKKATSRGEIVMILRRGLGKDASLEKGRWIEMTSPGTVGDAAEGMQREHLGSCLIKLSPEDLDLSRATSRSIDCSSNTWSTRQIFKTITLQVTPPRNSAPAAQAQQGGHH